jgi:hypothetical protein
MVPVCVEQCGNGNRHVQGKEMAPRFTMAKEQTTILCQVAMLKKIFYLKQVVIYLLRIWNIKGIPQSSASCVRVVYIEVMGIRPNVH